MPRVQRSAIVPYSADEMFKLVTDINKYGEFLPWCSGARILQQKEDKVTAQVDIAFKSVKQSFTTENVYDQGKQITMVLKEGPFSALDGVWQFIKLDQNSCKILFDLEFDFANKLAGAVIGPVFGMIANGMVDAFHKRAMEVYGCRNL
jgi:ribosome-associated toxin RatA of RatAB toxin-antitoxin module